MKTLEATAPAPLTVLDFLALNPFPIEAEMVAEMRRGFVVFKIGVLTSRPVILAWFLMEADAVTFEQKACEQKNGVARRVNLAA